MARHGIMYAFGVVIGKAIAFIMLPIYTRYLTPADYGVINLVTLTIEVISIVAGSRIAGGIFHFYHKQEAERDRRAVLSTATLLLATTYGIGTLSAALVAPWIADAIFGSRGMNVVFVRIAAASLLFEGLFLVPISYLQLRKWSGAFVTVNVVRAVLQLGLNIVFLILLEMGVLGVMISSLVSNVLVSGTLAFWLLRDVGLQVRGPLVRSFLRFGVPLMAMQVATLMTTYGDRFFLNRAGGETAVGLFGLAYQFGALLYYFGYAPFERVWDPERFAIARRPDRDSVYARGWTVTNAILVTFAATVALFGGDVIRVIAAPAFHPAAVLVPVMTLAFLLNIWGVFHQFGIFVAERTELSTVATWVSAAVALAGYLLLVPPLLGLGAALTAVASRGTRFAMSYYFSQKVFPIKYDWGPVIRQCVVAVAVCAVGMSLPDVRLPWSLLLHAGLFAVYAMGIWWLGGLSVLDRTALVAAVRSPRRLIAAVLTR